MKLIKEKVLPIIINALREDVGSGDITGSLLFEKDIHVTADIIAKDNCVLCGIDVAKWIFNALDERIVFKPLSNDGDKIKRKKRVASLKGSVKNILAGERTALNFLGRLSGISTLSNAFSEKIKGTKAKALDTRKTTPGLRELEKYAVRTGGGVNHRMGLWDQVLIKDNHLALRSIEDAVSKAKARHFKNIEVEVDNIDDYKKALKSGADIVMLDNMSPAEIRKAVKLVKKGAKVMLEVSGKVNLENIRSIAKAGVDRISIGALTHSVSSIDFSLEIRRQ